MHRTDLSNVVSRSFGSLNLNRIAYYEPAAYSYEL